MIPKDGSAIITRVILAGIKKDDCSGMFVLEVFDPNTGDKIAEDPWLLEKKLFDEQQDREQVVKELNSTEKKLREAEMKIAKLLNSYKNVVDESLTAMLTFRNIRQRGKSLSKPKEKKLQEAEKFFDKLNNPNTSNSF